jgi:hypothetical protein
VIGLPAGVRIWLVAGVTDMRAIKESRSEGADDARTRSVL